MPKVKVRVDQSSWPWWRRSGPSLAVLIGLLVVVTVGVLVLSSMVGETMPDVARDKAGDDAWKDPLAVQAVGPDLQLAFVPECASGPITRIVLWDAESKPYWEVSGPPKPVEEFVVGFPVDGFTTDVPFTVPPKDAPVRLVVFRRLGDPIGLRYTGADLTSGKIKGGSPLKTFTKDGWKGAAVCESGSGNKSSATTTPT